MLWWGGERGEAEGFAWKLPQQLSPQPQKFGAGLSPQRLPQEKIKLCEKPKVKLRGTPQNKTKLWGWFKFNQDKAIVGTQV